MNTEKIIQIEQQAVELNEQIENIKQKANLKVKKLQEKQRKLQRQKNNILAKLIDGLPSDVVIKALQSLKQTSQTPTILETEDIEN